MALPKLATYSVAHRSLAHVGAGSFMLGQIAWHYRPAYTPSLRLLSTTPRMNEQKTSAQTAQQQQPQQSQPSTTSSSSSSSTSPSSSSQSSPEPTTGSADDSNFSLPAGWEDDPQLTNVKQFSDLPHRYFGYNQHIKINEDFKESLRQVLWQFRAPIRYAFAYGSGVFGQVGGSGQGSAGLDPKLLSPHPNPPKAVEEWQKGGAKVLDFIFGVSHTQHWHSLNLTQHPDHYSALQYLPYSSAAISWVQDRLGAGVYFNPYITVNGVMIKYGVVNLDTLAHDLSDWNTLYLAGRLQKPVKILRDDPRIRLANQINLLSALRTALLMLPEKFTERQLYEKIAGLSYMGDPRMVYVPGLGASENMSKVHNIVGAQLPGFRQLYVPLIENLPNIDFTDSRTPTGSGWEKDDAIRHTGSNVELDEDVLGGKDGLSLTQSMSPVMRGNMVRRLPKAFRMKLYYQYRKKFQIPGSAFDEIVEQANSVGSTSEPLNRREGGEFEQRIADQDDLSSVMAKCVQGTVQWPATSQTIKSFFTAGVGRAWRYYKDKRKRSKESSGAKTTDDQASSKDGPKSDGEAKEKKE
ncbi:mitochondrial matrix Mmp37-domain-containing protein [Neohortaea acidophila]|uniref:Phosphatidate cytidylyltransferase, mitochondrial n=1 Tax=Neohortaea acidophila TaxID=245834 RepID=A0A6A6PJ67_9PEZI|nr:mitochondrial matrix Mmp37-domain-containing protein [Neohortaea acidophila]KAF2480032.1 mitochondrial matrix Mmp37-domain-containing protein [Neohortaea acidophila]